MKWFKNLRISSKLILCFVIIAIMAGAVGGVGIISISTLKNNDEVLYKSMTVPLGETAQLAKLFETVRIKNRDMILENDTEAINTIYSEIETLVNQMNERAEAFKATILNEEEQKAYDNFIDARVNFRSSLEKLLKLCLSNSDTEAYALIKGELQKASTVEEEAIDTLVQMKEDAARAKSEENQATAATAVITMIIIAVFAVLFAILEGVVLNVLIGGPVKQVARAADTIADGDLNIEIDINTKDEMGKLARAFQKMAYHINETLTNISLASDQVALGSRQSSDSSQALSQGATEQASAIEELSASMEEIAAQTKMNAENASQANQLAVEASSNAEEGNCQMAEMLKAMEEINISSSNISKIIKVIDDIAFQTNILALNAAVEAARAGQHGKGFAVVAEEVRNLAARSAKAAKETTDMIENSIKKVDGGTKLANRTAEALSMIVKNIAGVATLVNEISTASNEQALAVSQVNQGILQVSGVVQTNSATSEENAAVSEELSSQAETLKEQVMRFRLRDEFGSQSHYRNEEYVSPEVLKRLDMRNEQKGQTFVNADIKPAKTNRKIMLNDAEFGKY